MHGAGNESRLDACHRDAPGFPEHLRAAYGYRVIGPHGRVGTVEGHIYNRDDALVGLTVRRGFLMWRSTTMLPLSSVEWVLPFGRRLLLAPDERRFPDE